MKEIALLGMLLFIVSCAAPPKRDVFAEMRAENEVAWKNFWDGQRRLNEQATADSKLPSSSAGPISGGYQPIYLPERSKKSDELHLDLRDIRLSIDQGNRAASWGY